MDSDDIFQDTMFYEIKHERTIDFPLEKVEFKLCITSARNLIRHAKTYTWNRTLDEEHVNLIYNDLKEMRTHLLIGTIKLIGTKKENYYVFDGQHRFAALSKIVEDDINMEWDMDLITEIYFINSDDIKNSETAKELFKLANKTLNFKIEDTINEYIIDLTKELSKDEFFKENIKEAYSVNRPRISKKELYNHLQKNFKPNFHPPIKDVITLIKRINNELSINMVKAIGEPKNTLVYKKNEEKYKKAIKYKFVLNLETYPPKNWIDDLNQIINKEYA